MIRFLKSLFEQAFLVGAIFLILCAHAAAQTVQTLSGVADSIDAHQNKLKILFEHPVTGEETVKEFDVSSSTGFKNVKRLEQIRPNDPVSIDYEESENGDLKAIYIEVVSLRKVPFTREQVRKKIRFPL